MELWFNDFQNSTSLLVILEIIPGGDHAWPAWMSPTGHSSPQSMETGWAPPADSWSQGVCWSPYLLGAGSVKLGCLAQIPASWGPSVMADLKSIMEVNRKHHMSTSYCHTAIRKRQGNHLVIVQYPALCNLYDLEKFESTRFYDWSWFYMYIEKN